MINLNNRLVLLRATKYLIALLALALLFVFVDFVVDVRPPAIHAHYRFNINKIPLDQPVWLRQDNLSILLIHRSKHLIAELAKGSKDLQDPDSISSSQPSYAKNTLRSKFSQYFVSFSLGTDLGCLLKEEGLHTVRESCGTARYDYAGRAIRGKNRFLNLRIPDYTFSQDLNVLIVNP